MISTNILVFRTHHRKNSITDLTLDYMYIIAHTVVVIVEEPLKQKTNHSHTRAMHWGERKWEMDCFAESQSTFLEMLPVSSICAKIFSRQNLSRFSSAEH